MPTASPAIGVLGWVHSVPTAGEVRADPAADWVTIAAILSMLILMGFVGELFNNTMEGNYDRILAWWRASLPGRLLARLGARLGTRPGGPG